MLFCENIVVGHHITSSPVSLSIHLEEKVTTTGTCSNVAVMFKSSVTVAGNSHQVENKYPSSGVAVTTTASSPVPKVSTFSSALIAVP